MKRIPTLLALVLTLPFAASQAAWCQTAESPALSIAAALKPPQDPREAEALAVLKTAPAIKKAFDAAEQRDSTAFDLTAAIVKARAELSAAEAQADPVRDAAFELARQKYNLDLEGKRTAYFDAKERTADAKARSDAAGKGTGGAALEDYKAAQAAQDAALEALKAEMEVAGKEYNKAIKLATDQFNEATKSLTEALRAAVKPVADAYKASHERRIAILLQYEAKAKTEAETLALLAAAN